MKPLLAFLPVGVVLLLAPWQAAEAQQRPPRVEIIEPREWTPGARGIAVVQRRSLRVIGSVENPGEVRQIRLNGQPISFQEFPNGTVRFSGAMDVTPGTRRAVIEVRRADGEVFPYEYTLRPSLDDLPEDREGRWNLAADGFGGQRWALVIGISEYADTEIPDLRFAAQDAEAVAEFLRTPQAGIGGFSDENLLLLRNEEATFQNIRTALRSWLRQSTPDDVIYVFLAGHGLPDPNRPEDLYLVPHDARLDNFSATAIPMDEFQRDLDRLDSRATIVFTDACHSAGVGTGVRALGANRINDVFLDRMDVARGGLVTITSSQAHQISTEAEAYGDGHGVFTYFLLQGLQGGADRNGDGIVDIGEIFDYVQDAVRRATSGGQVPAISQRPFERAWPLSIALQPGEVLAWDEKDRRAGTPDVSASVFLGVYDESRRWHAPDSLVVVVGTEEVIEVRLGGPGGAQLPARMLDWRSSNDQVARITRDGRIHPLVAGLTTVTVGARAREIQIPVRVYDRPAQIRWEPPGEEIHLMRGENLRITVSMELPNGQVVRGVLPRIEVRDTLVLSRSPDGGHRAIREGETAVTASLGGQTRHWPVRVRTPILRIQPPAGALLIGEPIELPARYVRDDGSVLGEALGVAWQSSDPSVVEVDLTGLIPRAPGRAVITAEAGTARDDFTVTVLGDLLMATRGADGRYHLRTVVLRSGESFTIHSELREIRAPALSPDGSAIAFVGRRDRNQPRIYVMDADGRNIRRLNDDGRFLFGLGLPFYQEHGPAWSQDGSRVFYASNASGSYQIYSVTPDGSDRRRLTRERALNRSVTAAPDAPRIAFEQIRRTTEADVVVTLETGAEPVNITAGRRSTAPISARKPSLVARNQGLLLVETSGHRDGEALALFDLSTRQRLRELVSPQRAHEILYAVSPNGDRIAYIQRPTRGTAAQVLVIMDMEGASIQTVPLPRSDALLDLAWGAAAHSTTGGSR
jgi:Tol biopolymer transport system component